MNVTDIGMLKWRNLQTTERVAAKPQTDRGKLQEACQDFEAIFVKQMLDAMRDTVNKTSLFGRNMAEDIFEDMLYDEYAKEMSKNTKLGISEMMFKQLSQNNTPKTGNV
jgi:peptidoglycan hydrolase FlgJ